MEKIKSADLIRNASWFPHRLDMARRTVTFGRFTRNALSDTSFLDFRIESAAQAWAEVSIDELLAASPPELSAKPAFLFHTSYCCSTLLSRVLDQPGRVLALKEPEIIMGLSNAYRMAQNQNEITDINKLRDVVLSLIARPHIGDERALIKPTNAANNITPIIAALNIPVVLLYGDLRGFLASVIKKGDPCKTIIRQIFRVYAMDNIGVSVIPQRDALALTDLQIAALVWRHQIEMFHTILSDPKRPNARSLDFRTLLRKPAETIKATSDHMSFDYNTDDCDTIAKSDLFRKDAKDDKLVYDAAQRSKEEDALIAQNADALDLIENWVFELSLWPTTTKSLPKPLVE